MIDLEMFEPKMPTGEQHRQVSLAWLSRVQPTLIDQWPKELAALSMPTKLVRIDVPAVWDDLCSYHDGNAIGATLISLSRELDYHIGWHRHFIRLNSRSPKDYPWPFEVSATISGKEAVVILVNSMRIMDDLMEFKYVPEQPAYVALRQFNPSIRGENEFRCFVKDGELIAITHYDYTKPTPEWVSGNAAELRGKIDAYFKDRLRPTLHVQTVVFDIAMVGEEFILIEINPYGLSDPCHFETYERVEAASSFIEVGS